MDHDYLVMCYNEIMYTDYDTFEELRSNEGRRDIFDAYFLYEGISGYTNAILEVLDTLGMLC